MGPFLSSRSRIAGQRFTLMCLFLPDWLRLEPAINNEFSNLLHQQTRSNVTNNLDPRYRRLTMASCQEHLAPSTDDWNDVGSVRAKSAGNFAGNSFLVKILRTESR